MYDYYYGLFENKTRYLDPRIKETDLYENSRQIFINQGKKQCNCVVYDPSLIVFKYKFKKNVGCNFKYDVLHKDVIKIQDDYCLAYSEERVFNTKHNLVNLDINVEFMFTEKISISAFKNQYGTILNASHFIYSESDNSYSSFAHIPSVGISDFYLIPYGEIFCGCYPETSQMFEDFYSSILYDKEYIKLL